MNINYIDGNDELFCAIEPLWNKTKDYHASVSTYFSAYMTNMTFSQRTDELCKNIEGGELYIVCAVNADTQEHIGYCISAVTKNKIGSIESLYVDPAYRNCRVATTLFQKSLDWMNNVGVTSKELSVAVGNEEVIDFYKKHHFYPYQIILKENP